MWLGGWYRCGGYAGEVDLSSVLIPVVCAACVMRVAAVGMVTLAVMATRRTQWRRSRHPHPLRASMVSPAWPAGEVAKLPAVR